MLKVTSAPLELRGIVNNTSKKGNMYYTLNCESEDGSPHALYCPKFEALPQGLKKGDKVKVTFEVTKYQSNERLVVAQVERAN